jgi:hypothetical protein
MMAGSALPWLTYFVAAVLFLPWPGWALLFQLGALAHWMLHDPNGVWREAFPELDDWWRW